MFVLSISRESRTSRTRSLKKDTSQDAHCKNAKLHFSHVVDSFAPLDLLSVVTPRMQLLKYKTLDNITLLRPSVVQYYGGIVMDIC